MRFSIGVAVLAGLLSAGTAFADRTAVYSITGVDCADCANPIKSSVKKIKGVRKLAFDQNKVELTVVMDDHVRDGEIVAAVAKSGPNFKGIVGPGHGAYIPFGEYPRSADVAVLTHDGSAVGPFEKLRVPGKYTVFDVYADWCGPCRVVDGALREIVEHRKDIAVRKLNVVDFQSPLAREQGTKLKALPYVVVFTPSGKRKDFVGNDTRGIAAALRVR